MAASAAGLIQEKINRPNSKQSRPARKISKFKSERQIA